MRSFPTKNITYLWETWILTLKWIRLWSKVALALRRVCSGRIASTKLMTCLTPEKESRKLSWSTTSFTKSNSIQINEEIFVILISKINYFIYAFRWSTKYKQSWLIITPNWNRKDAWFPIMLVYSFHKSNAKSLGGGHPWSTQRFVILKESLFHLLSSS